MRKAIKLAINWPAHNENTLGDLIERLEALSDEHRDEVWDAVDGWASGPASDEAKAALRERIRRFAFTRYGRRRDLKPDTRNRAREAFTKLTAKNPVVRYRWLFADTWVEESHEELEDIETNFSEREKRIQNERLAALREIWAAQDFDGILALLAQSGAPHIVGNLMAQVTVSPKASAQFIKTCLQATTGDMKSKFEECVRGYFLGINEASVANIVAATEKALNPAGLLTLYLCMPFRAHTWRLLDKTSEEFRKDYWANVRPQWGDFTTDEINELTDSLLEARRPVAAFHAVHMYWEKVETLRLKKLLTAVATTPDEKPKPYKFSQYDLSSALTALDGRAGVTVDDMAHLEFLYIKALDHSEHGIPNIEKQIASSPELFVQAVAFSFRRSDDKEDPPELKIEDPGRLEAVASATYSLLHRARRTPGTGADGKIDADQLKNWLVEVRSSCERHGRAKIADQMIGELLSKAPPGEDGLWPCRPVCEALEWMASPDVATGFEVGTRNSRGAHWVGDDGGQERELAARYRGFAMKLAFEFPHVGSILERIAASYEHEARWQDADGKVRSRLPY
jgi:hypothetical protein